MDLSTLLTVLSISVLCNGSSLNDIHFPKVGKRREISIQQREVLFDESRLNPHAITIETQEDNDEEIDGFTGHACFNLSDTGYESIFGKDNEGTPNKRQNSGSDLFLNPQTESLWTAGVSRCKKTRVSSTATGSEITARLWDTTQATTTTKAPARKSNLVKVTIFSHDLSGLYPSYQFSIKKFEKPVLPWRKIQKDDLDLASLYLYKKATPQYSMAIAFCSTQDKKNGIKKWNIKKRRCPKRWSEEFTLYGSPTRRKSSQRYTVGNRGKPFWTSRVSADLPSKGYISNHFYFYGPKIGGSQPARFKPTRATTTRQTRKPRTTPSRVTRRPRRTKIPTTTLKPTSRGDRPEFPVTQPDQKFSITVFDQNCLRAHNFFRAVHNVPPLKWSAKLARSAQSWANELKRIAPDGGDELKFPHLRTKNWPHSDSGSKYRNRGDGENIAWDLSVDGSPVQESIQRFYAEIFYFNRKKPTRAPAPDKPVGHLTQLLWKDTTHVGCGIAVSESTFLRDSTWTVVHYSPGGNIYYENNQRLTNKLYNEQVPDMEKGACMTRKGSCNNGNQCMAFGPSRGTCSCKNERPLCRSDGGCIAWCENKISQWPWKNECFGRSSCSCGDEGATCQ